VFVVLPGGLFSFHNRRASLQAQNAGESPSDMKKNHRAVEVITPLSRLNRYGGVALPATRAMCQQAYVMVAREEVWQAAACGRTASASARAREQAGTGWQVEEGNQMDR